MWRDSRTPLLTAAVASLALGCGSSSEQVEPTTPEPEPTTPGEPAGATGGEGASAAGSSWADLDHEGRMALMRERVLPEMGELFREHDAEEHATFTCATCHGESMTEVGFRMPNGLHPLVRAEIPALVESEDEETARTARFMLERVTPGMIEILGVAPYDPATGEGFGCLRCHDEASSAE